MATATIETPVAPPANPSPADNGLGMGTFLTTPADLPQEEAKASPDVTPAATPEVTPAPTPETPKVEVAKETKEVEKDTKELAKLTKQLKDTRDAFTQERQTNKALLAKMQTLEQNIGVITKKLDGTYDEEKDAPKAQTPADMEAAAETRATIRTSHFAAVEYLIARDGLSPEEADTKVKELVWNEDAPFRAFDQDKAVQARVMGAHVPIIEALKVVREAEEKKKYGSDPAAMHKAIEQEVRTTLEKEIREQVLKELKGKGVAIEEVRGLGDVRSVTPERSPQATAALTLESLFPNFKP